MITVDTAAFSAGLKGWAERFNIQNDVAVRNVASRLFERIIRLTPVDTGWARANWYPTLNRRVDPQPGPAPEGATKGQFGAADAAATVAQGKAGDVFMLQNGVPYIGALENGSSQKAPGGMVKMAIAEVEAFYGQYAKGGA